MTPERSGQPSPALLFDTFNAYQRTQAVKTGIELKLFTAIGEGKKTVKEIANRCRASERGIRILCDFLTIIVFVREQNGGYDLRLDSATFLDERLPAYMGRVRVFIMS